MMRYINLRFTLHYSLAIIGLHKAKDKPVLTPGRLHCPVQCSSRGSRPGSVETHQNQTQDASHL